MPLDKVPPPRPPQKKEQAKPGREGGSEIGGSYVAWSSDLFSMFDVLSNDGFVVVLYGFVGAWEASEKPL